MQTGSCWVESDVATHWTTAQEVANLIGVLVEEATPFKVIEQRMRSHGTKIDEEGMIFYAILIR